MVYFYKNNFSNALALDVNHLGLLRGYTAFEYLRTYDRKPFCLQAHLYRFLFSIHKMGLICPYSRQQLTKITLDLINQEPNDCGVKWYAAASKSPDSLRHTHHCEVFAFTLPMTPNPEHYYSEGIQTATVMEQRPLPEAKTTAYFTATQILSQRQELQELIYLDQNYNLLEAATSNLFLVKNKTLYTAQTNILHGITREVVLNLVKNRFEVEFEQVNYSDLARFNEVFITATNKEIMPVRSINNLQFHLGPVTQEIMEAFQAIKNSNIDYIPPLYQLNCLS